MTDPDTFTGLKATLWPAFLEGYKLGYGVEETSFGSIQHRTAASNFSRWYDRNYREPTTE
jgi:hypothetical protein